MDIGDRVIVKDPRPNDLWSHSFPGMIVDLDKRSETISVMDQDENVYDMNLNQARPATEEE